MGRTIYYYFTENLNIFFTFLLLFIEKMILELLLTDVL